MFSKRPIQTRYATTARRTLARQAALAALVVVPGIACGTSDAAVFESASARAATTATEVVVTPTDEATPTDAATATAADPTTSATTPESTATPVVETTVVSADAAMFPASAELAVSFSFVPSSTGRRVNNPYIAVWVEDLDGNLVQTISIWYEQSGKGKRWLSDLPRWYSASGQASDVTMSGATQVAGDYTVVWDGTGLDGNAVAQGEYVVYVEAAREHGPYEITSQQITIGTDAFTVALDDSGELSNVSASLIA